LQHRIEGRHDLTSLRGANSTGEPLEDPFQGMAKALRLSDLEHYGISEAQMVIGDVRQFRRRKAHRQDLGRARRNPRRPI